MKKIVDIVDNRVLRKLQQNRAGSGRIYYSVCIPKQLVDALNWKKGDLIKFHISGKGTLGLHKSQPHDYMVLK